MTRQPTADRAAFVRSLRQPPPGKEIPVDNGGFDVWRWPNGIGVDPYGGWYNQDADSPAGWQKIGIAGVVAGGDAPFRPNLTDGGQWGFGNGKSEFNPVSAPSTSRCHDRRRRRLHRQGRRGRSDALGPRR